MPIEAAKAAATGGITLHVDGIRGVNSHHIAEAAFKALARALRRPALLPVPAPAMRLALGEMAEALLLSSTKARPTVLEDTGYEFKAPTLAKAFEQILP